MPTPSTPPSARWIALFCIAGAAALTVTLWLTLAPETMRALIEERGPVERLTEWGYFGVAGGLAVFGRGLRPRTRVALALVMLGFGAREMDLHKTLTGTSVLKLGFYAGPAPWPTKLVAALVVLAVAAALVWLLRRHAGAVWRGWRERRPAATSVIVFVAVLLFSKVLDRAPAILAEDSGVVLSASLLLLVNGLEEMLELALPLVLAVACWQQGRTDAAPR